MEERKLVRRCSPGERRWTRTWTRIENRRSGSELTGLECIWKSSQNDFLIV